MIRKLLALAALLLGLLAAGAVPAAAGGGPSDYANCVLTVDPATFEAGDVVTVAGVGFEPDFTTTIEFHSVVVVVGSATTDATGAFTSQITIPSDATDGDHTISAICDSQGNISSSDVVVSSTAVEPPPQGPLPRTNGPLPRTGTDVQPLLVAAAIAVLAGVAFVLVARRRRRAASSP